MIDKIIQIIYAEEYGDANFYGLSESGKLYYLKDVLDTGKEWRLACGSPKLDENK